LGSQNAIAVGTKLDNAILKRTAELRVNVVVARLQTSSGPKPVAAGCGIA
jgi:hypothetical protein